MHEGRLSLPEHHDLIERLLGDVKIEVRKDDPRELYGYWSGFVRELEDHMAAEEEVLLPEFAVAHPAEAVVLSEQHGHFRRRLAELGVQIDLHCLRAETIDVLVEELRAHARREDLLLYPWAATHVRGYEGALALARRRRRVQTPPVPKAG